MDTSDVTSDEDAMDEREQSAQEVGEDEECNEESFKDTDWVLLEDDACTDQADNDEEEDERMNEDVLPSDCTVWLVQYNNDQCIYFYVHTEYNVRVHIALYNVCILCLRLHTA